MRILLKGGLVWAVFAWLVLNLPTDSLWYDETVNAYLATSSWSTIWNWTTEVDNQLPLHFLMLKLWVSITGESEFSLRLFSSLSVWLAVSAVYVLAVELYGKQWLAWIAVIVFLLLGGTQYAAYEVRTYALSLVLLAYSVVYLVKILNVSRLHCRHALIFSCLSALLATTHYTAWLVLPVFGCLLMMWRFQHDRYAGLGYAAIVMLPAALVSFGWLLLLGGRDIRAGTAFEGNVDVQTAVETYISFAVFGQKLFTTDAVMQASAVAVLAGFSMIMQLWRFPQLKTLLVVLLAVVPIVAMVFAVNQVQGKLSGRHTWALWLVTPLVLVGGIHALTMVLPLSSTYRTQVGTVLGAILVIGVVTLSQQNLSDEYTGDLRGAIVTVNTQASPDDLLVLRDGTLFTAAEYYDVEIDYIGMPTNQLTDVNYQVQFYEALEILNAANFKARPRIWVLSWQADTMDPTRLGLVLPEYYSTGERRIWQEGGIRGVALYSYDIQPEITEITEHLTTFEGVIQVPPDGPSLLGIDVFHHHVNTETCSSIAQGWWWRGATDYPNTMVSVRIVTVEGERLVQTDQPPAGYNFSQVKWTPFVPTVDRHEVRYPCVWKQQHGSLLFEMVVYDANGVKPEQRIALGVIE